MPRVPLAVGDKVALWRPPRGSVHRANKHLDSYNCGVVMVVSEEGPYVTVWWNGHREPDTHHEASLEALCSNCLLPLADHADNRKCLYAPTYWKGVEP